MRKVLVLGKNGQLGRALQRLPEFSNAVFVGRDTVDLSHPKQMRETLEGLTFETLVNAAAYTAVDRAESERAAAHTINADAPAVLAELCRQRGALMVHLSTDYVFGPTAPRPISEDHPTEPINVYGTSKRAGELAVVDRCPHHLIVRTAWLYGPDGHNFVKTMLHLAESRDSLNVVYDQVGAPTSVDDLAKAISVMVSACSKNNKESLYGTYHFANEGVASWYDVAQAIFEIAGNKMNINPVRSSEFPTAAKRPAYSVLDKTKIKDNFDLKIRHWRQALRHCLEILDKA